MGSVLRQRTGRAVRRALLYQFRFWHWIRGHGRPKLVPFEAEAIYQELLAKGFTEETAKGFLLILATTPIDRCPGCGAEWSFSAMTFSETYRPEGGTLVIPDLR